MKVGILTFHRAHNYGAVLQCFALQETLNRHGHDAYVIDYVQPDIEDEYKFRYRFNRKEFFSLKSTPILMVIYLFYYLVDLHRRWRTYQKRKYVFTYFRRRYLRMTRSCTSIPQDFDAYIIGSDMLWDNVCMHGNFDNCFLGDFKRKPTSKVVAYAVSGTPTSFDLCGKRYNFNFLKNFSSVSIREKNLLDIVAKYSNVGITHCIDPTLLAEESVWDSIKGTIPESNYVLSYFLRSEESIRKEISAKLNVIAEKEGYLVIDIDPSKAITVQRFITLIRSAKYVITDSFHGTVFSIVFKRSFNSLVLGDDQDARYVDLLVRLGLENLIVQRTQNIHVPNIDYITVNQLLNEYRKESKDYLVNSL